MANSQLIRFSLILTGPGTFAPAVGEAMACLGGRLFMSLHPFGELRHQRTKPPALLNGVGRPIPLPIVPIPGALWRPWAKPAVQAAPPAAADGRALAGRPALVLAPHRGAVSRLASRVWTVWFKGLISEFPCPPPTALELGTKCRKCRKCTKPWLKSFLHLLHLLTACFLHFLHFLPLRK